MPDGATDPSDFQNRLTAKLQPERLRSTLAFAGLFQLTHEMLKSMVLDDVKSFYGFTPSDEGGVWIPPSGELEYRRKVLDLNRSRFTASLLWLQEMGAVDGLQVARLDDVYAHRHDLTHELAKYLVDPNAEPDHELLVEALTILKALSRFWVQVEVDIGIFDDFADLDLDEVSSGRDLIIDLAISAFIQETGRPEG